MSPLSGKFIACVKILAIAMIIKKIHISGARRKNRFLVNSKVDRVVFIVLKRKNPAIMKKKSTQTLQWRRPGSACSIIGLIVGHTLK